MLIVIEHDMDLLICHVEVASVLMFIVLHFDHAELWARSFIDAQTQICNRSGPGRKLLINEACGRVQTSLDSDLDLTLSERVGFMLVRDIR